MTGFIFVTGGVVSSVGKGITVASIGRMLKSRGITVSVLKLDPYLNVDPGTMSPYQHGEVYVTTDGCETDLDLGHYERFIDIDLTESSNVTAGQIFSEVIAKERRGESWRSAGPSATWRGSRSSRPSARCATRWAGTTSSTRT